MRKHMWAFLYVAVTCIGCTSSKVEVDQYLDWGTGVRDPDYVREKVLKILSNKQIENRFDVGSGMLLAMNWEQGCYVYRTSPAGSDIKILMCSLGLFEGGFQTFVGMTRGQVVKILGQPDDVWGTSLVYTGCGYVTDSTPGYIFEFDDEGKVDHIVSAS